MLDGFMIEYNGLLCSEQKGFSKSKINQTTLTDGGSTQHITEFISSDDVVGVRNIVVTYSGLNIVEKWVEVKNRSKMDITITRVDSIHGTLSAGKCFLKYFTSINGGTEYTPADTVLEGTKILETTTGRSARGTHPWFCVEGEDGSVLVCSIAWSGNWIARFEPIQDDCYCITAGLSNWNFTKVLKTGMVMEGVHVIYTILPYGDLDTAVLEFGRWGRKYWYPKNALSNSIPFEWNHWWPYTDKYINEDIFKENVNQCKELCIDVCTLDAGWFGPSDEGSEWYKVRGDWNKVNVKRFPSGIRVLADYTHSNGIKFGIWCEIEAVGAEAELNRTHPEFVARRHGNHLGYVCMGNPEAVQWAFGILETLIIDYKADWIKLDFNLNPGAGCNRSDHGHGEGDGLYEHYMGYYRLLDMVREKYPDVILENCSSGGFRVDLGMQKHTHLAFLSDPDYSPHALQVFWGTAAMLHPSVCLHWSWSQTTDDYLKNCEHNPIKEDMPMYKFDYIIRNTMLKCPGFSYKLPEMPQWCLQRLKFHIRFQKNVVKSFIRDADMYRLTGQPLRNGEGDRWSSFVYVTENKNAAILFVFRLPGGEKERLVKLKGLKTDAFYRMKFQDSSKSLDMLGCDLMNSGILFNQMEEESSEVIIIKRTDEFR